jgi:hypothetical protein
MLSQENATVLIPFLEDRNYVQGSSILDSLVSHFGHATDIVFKINDQIACNHVAVIPFDTSGPPPEGCSSTLVWADLRIGNEVRKGIGLFPTVNDAKEYRLPFDETGITKTIDLVDTSAEVKSLDNFGFARTLVATNKYLLQEILVPESPGRWLFTRLDISHWPGKWETMRISFNRNLRFQLVTSGIELDGRNIGTVYFSWNSL